jgi:hypothetical protein
MAGGIAKDGAAQDQIDATIADAVSHARHRLPYGERLKNCARIKVTVTLIRCGHEKRGRTDFSSIEVN